MAEKDIAEKILESYNDVFADILFSFLLLDPSAAHASPRGKPGPRVVFAYERSRSSAILFLLKSLCFWYLTLEQVKEIAGQRSA